MNDLTYAGNLEMKPTFEEIKRTILQEFDDQIQFITIFGSRARQTDHALSDTDVAVKTNVKDLQERNTIRLQLIAALNGPQTRVDLVMVEDVDWDLKYRIARDGRVLLNRDNSWERFVESVIKYYPDYNIWAGKILKESLRRKSP